nr:MAG: capsid protein [Nodaviridae sp.]
MNVSKNKKKNSRAKAHVCPVDGRRFATQRALEQHRCTSHEMAGARSRASRRGSRNAASSIGLDIAPSRVPPPPGSSITIVGEDRVLSKDVAANSSLLQSIPIQVGMSQRLATIAKAYQRIRWTSVEFIVTPQASAVTNGGYVCGFIMDPTDQHMTADVLSANQGAQTKKWYETATVRMPMKNELLYTSDSEEPRLSEPARFWIASEGKPSSALTIIVTCRWRVSLQNPTIESNSSDSFVLVGDLRSKKKNYNMSYYPHCSNTAQDDFSSQIPERLQAISGSHFFRVPTFTIEYEGEAKEILSDQMHYVVYKTTDKKAYYSSDGKAVNTTAWADAAEGQYLVPEGTFFKYIGMGNVCVEAERGLHAWRSKELESSSTRLSRMERLLDELRVSLVQSSRTSRRTSRDSSPVFLEKPTLMASFP